MQENQGTYRLVKQDRQTGEWIETRTFYDAPTAALALWHHALDQPLEVRGAMMQPIAYDYSQSCRREESDLGDLMALPAVDIIARVLEFRLANPACDEDEDAPMRLLCSWDAGPGACRLVWTRPCSMMAQFNIDVKDCDGLVLESTFSLPVASRDQGYAGDALANCDAVFGTHLLRHAFKSLRISERMGKRYIGVADLLNAEAQGRI